MVVFFADAGLIVIGFIPEPVWCYDVVADGLDKISLLLQWPMGTNHCEQQQKWPTEIRKFIEEKSYPKRPCDVVTSNLFQKQQLH